MIKNKICKRIFLILLWLLGSIALANAECNFKINLGEGVSKVKKLTIIKEVGNSILRNYYVYSKDICPNEDLDKKILINYTFIEDQLATIRIIVKNNNENTISNKFQLMNYVKKIYGDFDTGQNPKIYNYFNVWKKNNKIIIYKRIKNSFNIIEEELFITNKKYKNKMKLIKTMSEKREIKG
jgi:hypothetical protein